MAGLGPDLYSKAGFTLSLTYLTTYFTRQWFGDEAEPSSMSFTLDKRECHKFGNQSLNQRV